MSVAFGLFALVGGATWFALVGRAGPAEWIWGVPVVLSAWWLLVRTAEFELRLDARRGWRMARGVGAYLACHVAPEVLRSTWEIARKVLRRRIAVQPAILAVHLPEATPGSLLVLAYGISLTPSQLIVAIDEERRVLYVHTFDVPDPEAVAAAIRQTFDRYLKEAFPC